MEKRQERIRFQIVRVLLMSFQLMLRIGLTVYLMLIMLAGQAFCCCATVKLLTGPSNATTAGAASPTKEQHSCCQKKNLTAEPNHQKSNPRERPLSSPCPCQEESASSPLWSTINDATQSTEVREFFAAYLVDQPLLAYSISLLELAARRMPETAQALAFCTTLDLLQLLSVLRC